jgi:hypothetical protein
MCVSIDDARSFFFVLHVAIVWLNESDLNSFRWRCLRSGGHAAAVRIPGSENLKMFDIVR